MRVQATCQPEIAEYELPSPLAELPASFQPEELPEDDMIGEQEAYTEELGCWFTLGDDTLWLEILLSDRDLCFLSDKVNSERM